MPPGVPGGWDDLDVWTQAKFIAYEQTRQHDENPPAKKGSKPKPAQPPKRRRR